MKVTWDREAWTEYVGWQAQDTKVVLRINILVVLRINILIAECQRHPFSGTGKPEPLKRNLSGWWSRRITSEHRLVYRVSGTGDAQALEILSCRYHY